MSDKEDTARKPAWFDSALAAQVRDSAQQIWLAGMGAFAKAQAEGKQVFEALVKEGATLQKKTQREAEERFGDVAGRMQGMAAEASAKAGQHWDRLEGIFEERTAKALKRLGVPSARDLEALGERIDALAAQVARLSDPKARAPGKRSVARGATTTTKRATPTSRAPAGKARKPAR